MNEIGIQGAANNAFSKLSHDERMYLGKLGMTLDCRRDSRRDGVLGGGKGVLFLRSRNIKITLEPEYDDTISPLKAAQTLRTMLQDYYYNHRPPATDAQ